MKIKVFLMLILCGIIFAGCFGQEYVNDSTDPNDSSTVEICQNHNDTQSILPLSIVYETKMDGDLVLPAKWLSNSLIGWINKINNVDKTIYQVHVLDIKKECEMIIYEKEAENDCSFDMNIFLENNNICLYFFDNMETHSLYQTIVDAENWEIISEKIFNFPFEFSLNRKSVQNTIVTKKVFTEQINTFNWDIILHSLDNPEETYSLKQNSGTRYDFTNTIWSLSGDYFILLNHDAMGMDKYESLVDLFGYSKTEWPTKLQYDVFYKTGELAFSFTTDFIYRDDGSYSSEKFFWIPGNKIFLISTFYDATLNDYYTKEQLINETGDIVYNYSYAGSPQNYSSDSFDSQGVFYVEKNNHAAHLIYKNFYYDHIMDYGQMVDFVGDFIIPRPNPEGSLLLLIDYEQALKIVDLNQ